MKKIIPLILLALLWVIPACDDDDDDPAPTPTATLTVTVNYLGEYEGDYDTGSDREGDKINYVHLYSDIDATSTSNMTLYKEFSVTDNNTATDLTGIAPGDYYIIAFYDYRKGGGDATSKITQGDRYAFYDSSDGSPFQSDAMPLTITLEGPNTAAFEIERYWELDNSQVFIPDSVSSGTISFNVNFYDSADVSGSGVKQLYMFIYANGQMDPTYPRYNILYWGSNTVSTDTDITVTVTDVLTHYKTQFNVLFLLDLNTGGTHPTHINQGDDYIIYDGIMNLDGTPTVVEVDTGYSPVDDSGGLYTLQSGAVWEPTP